MKTWILLRKCAPRVSMICSVSGQGEVFCQAWVSSENLRQGSQGPSLERGVIKADRSLCHSTFPGELTEKQNSDEGKQRNKATIVLLSCFQANIPNSPWYMTSGSPSPASRYGESEGLAAFSHRWSDSDGWTITKHPKCPHGNISGAWDIAPNLGFFRSRSEYHSQKVVFPETTICSKRDLNSYYLGPDIQLSIVSCCLKVSLVFPPTSSSFFCWSFPGSHKLFNY